MSEAIYSMAAMCLKGDKDTSIAITKKKKKRNDYITKIEAMIEKEIKNGRCILWYWISFYKQHNTLHTRPNLC